VEGTKNVIKSAIETKSVKRVVLVSSCVAVYCTCERFLNKERFVYDEECWNGLDEEHSEECRKNKGPEKSYFAAKTAAEKEAWRMVKEANEKDPQRHLTLVTICPPVIFGSLLSSPTIETLNTSMQLLPGLFFRRRHRRNRNHRRRRCGGITFPGNDLSGSKRKIYLLRRELSLFRIIR